MLEAIICLPFLFLLIFLTAQLAHISFCRQVVQYAAVAAGRATISCADSEEKEAAEAFINFMCDPANSGANMDYICYGSPIAGAKEFMDPYLAESEVIYPDDEVLAKIEQAVQEKEKGGAKAAVEAVEDDGDELLPAAVDVVLETGQASVSMLQRRLKLGYARAARLVDQMEEKGVVGPFEGSKPRQLLITKEQWQEMQYRQNMTVPADAGEQPPHSPDTPPFDVDNALDEAGEDTF